MSEAEPQQREDVAIEAAMIEAAFRYCVTMVLDDSELMTQYRRLYGGRIGLQRSVIEAMVDKACGVPVVDDKEAREFFEFVRAYVLQPWLASLVREASRER